MQWAVCYLHANELPLRHLLQKLDGHTKGPYQYSGEIGSLLGNCEKRPIVSFSKIETDLPDTNYKDLSTDQQYLYRICQAVSDGICPADLAQTNPGKMSHSRWLTTANRVLRLYVSVSEPSNNLKLLAKFIVKVYSTMWFVTKAKPYLQFGARHLWQTIYLSRQFPETITAVVDKAILNNAFYAHPENILIAMLADERKHIRELAVRRILKARNNKPEGVRVFRIPNLNFEAQDYIDLIKWAECTITEPPLTTGLTHGELERFISKADEFSTRFGKFPCHTQAVERCVKLVTEAALKVCSEEARNGYIVAKLDARKSLPAYDNKGQYYK